jgi:hypothetical protein
MITQDQATKARVPVLQPALYARAASCSVTARFRQKREL